MKPVKQAKRYAKVLMNMVGVDAMPKALEELGRLDDLMAKSSDFKGLLVSPGFTKAEKESVLREVGAKLAISADLMKFVIHLTEIKVMAGFSEILSAAQALYFERKKRAKAVVMTPVEIGKEYEERLKASLKKLIDRDVDLEYVMDPSLLGGVLVKVGSTMYDSSVKGQLRLLKDELIKG